MLYNHSGFLGKIIRDTLDDKWNLVVFKAIQFYVSMKQKLTD